MVAELKNALRVVNIYYSGGAQTQWGTVEGIRDWIVKTTPPAQRQLPSLVSAPTLASSAEAAAGRAEAAAPAEGAASGGTADVATNMAEASAVSSPAADAADASANEAANEAANAANGLAGSLASASVAQAADRAAAVSEKEFAQAFSWQNQKLAAQEALGISAEGGWELRVNDQIMKNLLERLQRQERWLVLGSGRSKFRASGSQSTSQVPCHVIVCCVEGLTLKMGEWA